MTMQNVGMVCWPKQLLSEIVSTSGMGSTAITFDSTTDRLCYMCQAYQTDSITKIYFRTGTVTLGDTLEVRIESVLNGRPSGSLWTANGTGANPKGTVVIADTDDNVWKTVTLTDAANIIPGNLFAIVIVWSAESGGAGINLQFIATPIIPISGGMVPAIYQDTGTGTWSSINGSVLEWIIELTTNGITPFPNLAPLNGGGTITAYNNTTNPNERAAKIIPPVKMTVVGMSVAMFNIAAGGDFSFYIWDATDNPGASPTPLASTSSMDGDITSSTTADGVVNMFFSAPVTLAAGATYYAGIKPDTANNIGLGELLAAGTGAPANAIRAFGIAANTFHLSTRQWTGNDPGAWTDTTTTYPMISLLVTQFDDGVGGGGPIGNNMRGGFCNG